MTPSAPNANNHFDGLRFCNVDPAMQPKSLWEVLKWKCQGGGKKWASVYSERLPIALPHAPTSLKAVSVTYIGHATLLWQLEGLSVLTDPVFSDQIGPYPRLGLGVKRAFPLKIGIDELPPIDVIFISHNHYDHFDVPSLKKLWAKFQPLFVVPLKLGSELRRIGINKIVELDWWQSYTLDPRYTVTLTPAQHWSGRGLFDRCKTLWGGFILHSTELKIFFAGDSGYATHFKEIFNRFGAMDISFLPMGAYEPRWFMSQLHMNPQEAICAHQDLHSQQSIGMHFGSFKLSDEDRDQPVKDLNYSLKNSSIGATVFIAPVNGQTFHYKSPNK